MKTMYAITHVDSRGMRTLTLGNQGRHHHATFDEAQTALDLLRDSLRETVLGAKADTLEVRAVECYDHGDAVGIYFPS